MTEREKLIKAKIPCEETGIEIKRTICDICSPGIHCGVDAYVKDGKIIKIEGTKGFPANNGALCTKGAVGRQYLYRDDRIREPMRRVGPRGSGEFEPISWDEAFALAAKGLNASKEAYGAEATAFLCGYPKWYRTFFHRLAYSFGSPNYMTESSACWCANVIASRCIFGHNTMADIQNAKLVIIWGSDPFTKNIHQSRALFDLKSRGGTIIVIDPRRNAAADKLADLYLRPREGTDGYMANAMARHIIENGLFDRAFVEKYVGSFEEYSKFVAGFDMETAERISGVPAADIIRAAELFAKTDPSTLSVGTGMTHHKNGFNNVRAILSLAAVCGRFDRPGTLKPGTGPMTFCYSAGGFQSREGEFINGVKPKSARATVGLERFPLFGEMMNEGQSMALAEQIRSGLPYPIKSAFLAGVNHMMYPDSQSFLEALKSLDFIAASDIFWTESCRIADVVFPACTSYERSEIKCYANKLMFCTKPAVAPLYQSRSDVEIFAGLSSALGLEDELLQSGYEACARYMLEESSGVADWDAFEKSEKPVPAPNAKGYEWGSVLRRGPMTPTKKIELSSSVIAKFRDHGLDPLPTYTDSADAAEPEKYPFTLCGGTRNHNTIHSRIHACAWARSLRPEAAVDINPADAKSLGISQGNTVELSTPTGSITVKASLTLGANTGELHMGHGYSEANVNSLLSAEHLDPYTGFPAYKQFRCAIKKKSL